MTGVHQWARYVPLHQIAGARRVRNEHGTDMAELELRDRATWHGALTWDNFGEIATQIMPCELGVNLLHAWTEGNEPGEWQIGRTPLIGWALCVDGEIRPVTPSGVNDGCAEPEDIGNFVEMPDGKVVSTSPWAGRAGFDNAEEFLADALEVRGKKPPVAEAAS